MTLIKKIKMDGDKDAFKAPMVPATSSSHVIFKMPQPKKLTEDTQTHLASDQGKIESFVISENNDDKKVESTAKPMLNEEKKKDTAKLIELIEQPTSPALDSGYKPPVWSGPCIDSSYDLDILKDGRIVGNIVLSAAGDEADQTKAFYIFGRHGDLVVEHPSISRYHAIIQYRAIGDPHEIGWYLFDMGSTHGTFLNKEKIPPFMYVPIRVGHMFKLGFSTRMYILNGPEQDREPESDISVTEIKQRAEKQKAIMTTKRLTPSVNTEEQATAENTKQSGEPAGEASVNQPEDNGITWGMSDDYGEDEEKEKEDEADTGESIMESIEEIQKREQAYADDPQKALKNFFSREGCLDEMQFEFSERGTGGRHQWTCRIELPIESETGRPVVAEATVGGSKKEATIACALEACRILDAAGELRKSSQDSRKRKSREWAENDYYDSDEDTFLDRTGEVERKREKRMRQVAEADTGSGSRSRGVETYDSLSAKLHDVNTEINRVQQRLDLIKAEISQDETQSPKETGSQPNRDTLDTYMASMSRRDTKEAKVQQSRLRLKLDELKKTASRLEKLVKIAKPTVLPPIVVKKALPTDTTTKKQPILVGTMKGHRMRKLIPMPEKLNDERKDVAQVGYNDEEIEEVEEEEEKGPEPIVAGDAKLKAYDSESEQIKTGTLSAVDDSNIESSDNQAKVYTAPMPPPVEVESDIHKIEAAATSSRLANEQPPPSRQRIRKKKEKSTGDKESFVDYDPSDITYATWLPPENQSGDGRTSLNEKFGY